MLHELDDYKLYSHCRKHYRVSRNITNMYVRIGEKIIPQQGMRGHGGNNLKYSASKSTNQVYVENLYKTFNKNLAIDSECQINCANFALNKRPYDVTSSVNVKANPLDTAINFDADAYHTRLGLSMLHENMVRGMAAYCIPLDGINRNDMYIGGINTFGNTPWNVVIETDAENTGVQAGLGLTAERPANI